MASFAGQGPGGRRRRNRPADELAVKAALERTRAALLGTSPELPRVGRFEIRARLGRGGMGVVYAAHDPTLDRQLALKIVDVASPVARDRVLFEARAQARVSHRNVVPIFEVEDHGDQVAIAMEHMVGGDLTTWLAAAPRPWRRIVGVFVDAGGGLVAAHAAGLVHGDFKPDNVLLDGDGVPRVADFGLARLASDATTAVGSGGGGTPGYLAPEVVAGAPATAASDQYAFAVSLFAAIHGHRPTRERGDRRRDVPGWVDRVVSRGLADDPEARFPSVEALVGALADGLARAARRRRLAVGGTTLVIGAALALGAASLSRTEDVFECSPDAVALGAAWNPVRALAVEASFARSGRPFAASIVGPATRSLAAYHDRLGALAQGACHAAEEDPSSRAGYAEQARCFDQALTAVRTLADVWARATPQVVDHALTVTQALPLLEHCARAALARRAPLPASPAVRAVIAVTSRRLTVVTTAERAGLPPHALDELRSIVATSEQLGYAPLVAAAHNALGQALAERFDPAAPAAFEAALVAASEGRDDEAFASAGIGMWDWRLLREGSARAESLAPVIRAMATTLGDRHLIGQVRMLESETRRTEGDGQGCLDAALAALASFQQGSVEPQAISRTQLQAATCLRMLGDTAQAKIRIDQAERGLRAAYGPLHPDLAQARAELALIVQDTDGAAPADPLWREAISHARSAYGGDSDLVFDLIASLGSNLAAQGRFDEADAMLRGVEDAQRQRASRGLPKTLNVRGQIALGRGELGQAIAAHEEAARRFRLHGDLVAAGNAINSLGNALRAADRLTEARAAYQGSLELMEQLLGSDHPRVAIALSNLGEMALLQHDLGAAETFCRRALAIDEAHMSADNPALAYDLTCLGQALVGHGRAEDSLPLLERALALRTTATVGDLELGQTHLALAQALWSSTGARLKALRYARLAVAELARANAPAERLIAEKLLAAAKR